LDTSVFGPFFRPFDRFLEQLSPGGLNVMANIVPRIDVVETDKNIEITAEMPGLSEEDVDISLVDNVLTIRGEKRAEREEDRENYHVTERAYGAFYRAIELPAGVDRSSINASMANGVLSITIPKPALSETQKITVKKADDTKSADQAKANKQAA
jgi:HSP20 family protein